MLALPDSHEIFGLWAPVSDDERGRPGSSAGAVLGRRCRVEWSSVDESASVDVDARRLAAGGGKCCQGAHEASPLAYRHLLDYACQLVASASCDLLDDSAATGGEFGDEFAT